MANISIAVYRFLKEVVRYVYYLADRFLLINREGCNADRIKKKTCLFFFFFGLLMIRLNIP